MKREKCGSNATDIWACCVTMMKVLVGDGIVKDATKQVRTYLFASHGTFRLDMYECRVYIQLLHTSCIN